MASDDRRGRGARGKRKQPRAGARPDIQAFLASRNKSEILTTNELDEMTNRALSKLDRKQLMRDVEELRARFKVRRHKSA